MKPGYFANTVILNQGVSVELILKKNFLFWTYWLCSYTHEVYLANGLKISFLECRWINEKNLF